MGPSARSRFFTVHFPAWLLVLYRRPLLSLTTLVLAPVLIMCAWLYAEHERQWRTREADDLIIAAQLAGRIIDEELTRTQQIEEALASRPEFLAALAARQREALLPLLQLAADVTPMIDRVLVVDDTGRVLASAGRDGAEAAALQPADWTERVSGVALRDEASGEKVVAVSTPVAREGTALGVIQIQYRLQAIARWLQKVRIEPAGFVYVVDQHGYLAAYPYQVRSGTPKYVGDWPAAAGPTSPTGELTHFRQGERQRAWTSASVLVERCGWRVIAQQPDAAMLKPLRRLVWSFAGLIGVLAVLLVLLLSRWSQLHNATLRLVAQQAELLRANQQARLREMGKRWKKPKEPDGGA